MMKRIISSLAFCLLGNAAFAQTITFSVETTISGGNVIPRLTWSTTPTASSCTASGDAAWTGTKAASGTVTLAAVAPPRAYSLRCSFPGDDTATVKWTAPTTNTDGTPLTDLAGFRVLYGTSATSLTQSRNVPGAATVQSVFSGLTPGTWYFTARAYNTAGVESDNSNVASKTISGPVEITQAVGIKKPNAGTLSVE